MGQRVNYFIATDSSEGGQLAAILYSNSASETYNPVEVFKKHAKASRGASELMVRLMKEVYPAGNGIQSGLCPFSLDGCAGDNEFVLFADWNYAEAFMNASKLLTKVIELPAGTEPTMTAVKEALTKIEQGNSKAA